MFMQSYWPIYPAGFVLTEEGVGMSDQDIYQAGKKAKAFIHYCFSYVFFVCFYSFCWQFFFIFFNLFLLLY